MKALLVFLFLILVSSVSAQDFTAYCGNSFNSCSCFVIENPVAIENPNNFPIQVGITTIGEKPQWSTNVPDFLMVPANSRAGFIQFIHPSCAKPGSYDLGLRLASDGVSKDLYQNISVGMCGVTTNQTKVDIDSSSFQAPLTYSLYGFTVVLALLLVFLVIQVALNSKQKPKAEVLEIKRPSRYPWQAYFKRKRTEVKVEKKENSKTGLFLVGLIVLIILIIIVYLSYTPSLFDALNATNVTNATGNQITGTL